MGRNLSTLICIFLIEAVTACAQAPGIITTVAGNAWILRGDGGPAAAAPLGKLSGVATDAAGNVFASDEDNHLVVRISPSGHLKPVAGSGKSGYSGDGGPATQALLNSPSGVAVDAAGNLYIADSRNNRIRKVTPAGIISTVAGNNQQGYSGDGGPGTQASLNYPTGVAVDAAGNLYIADRDNHRIRKVTPAGIISTAAGNGHGDYSGDGVPATQASLYHPWGVAVDTAGNLYIADRDNHRIRKVTPVGIISTVTGNVKSGYSGDGGPATQASLYHPWGVAVDTAGNLYIADTGNDRVRKVTPAGIISTVAGDGSWRYSGDGGLATQASLYGPVGVAVDAAGNLYIADRDNHRIRKVTPAGIISTVAGSGEGGYSGDGGPATRASLKGPSGVAVDAAGNLYISDSDNNIIRKVLFGTTANLSISLTRAGNTGYASLVICGSGFASGTTVKLVRAGQPDIVASVVRVDSAWQLSATFDLTGKSPGVWDVVVTNPDGKSLTLAGGFTIEQGGQPQLWVRIEGPGRIRRGSQQAFTVRYGNSGNLDAERVSILLEIPRRAKVELRMGDFGEPFIYDPKDVPPEYGAETVMLETNVMRVSAASSGTLACSLRMDDPSSNQVTLRAAPVQHFAIEWTSAMEYAWSLSGEPGGVDSQDLSIKTYYLAADRLVLRGGHLNDEWVRHPYFLIGGRWYTQVADNGNRYMTVVPNIDLERQYRTAEYRSQGYDIRVEAGQFIKEVTSAQMESLKREFDAAVAAGDRKEWTQENCTQQPDTLFERAGVDDGIFPDIYYDTVACAGRRVDAVARAFGIDPGLLPGGSFSWQDLPGTIWRATHGLENVAESLTVAVVQSIDPNDKAGPVGSGTQRYIPTDSLLTYLVNFENLRTANAAAQEVVITDQLDTANGDLSTLRLGSVRFGSRDVTPSAGTSQEFTTDVDLRPAQNLLVRITARADAAGLLTWRFTSVDPATGRAPADPLVGFLPPNVVPPQGEGAVSFSVALRKGLSTGTRIRNKAVIVFDKNPPINTPEWLNTIDSTKPTSGVAALPATQSTAAFTVRWSGADGESGIRDYTLFVSESSGPYVVWLKNATAASATFGGEPGKSYAFYSVARDQAGNVEDAPSTADATTRVVNTVTVAASVNGASFGVAGSPLAPGSIVSIFGAGIDPTVSGSVMAGFVPGSSPPTLPTSLSGVSVKVGGKNAALFFVGVGGAVGMAAGAFQINCQVPAEIAVGVVRVEVSYNNTTVATGAANIASSGPGVFSMTQNGQGQAVVLNEDGSLNGDPARPAVPGIQPRPAERGKAIVIYGTGPGPQLKDSKTGQPIGLGTGQAASCAAEPLYVTAETPVVTIGTVPAQVFYTGMAPCFVGLWQLNVKVPEQAPTGGAVPLAVSIGGRVSNTTTIAVQ